MKVTVEENEKCVLIQVSDFPEHLSHHFDGGCFTRVDDRYLKEIPRDLPHLDIVVENYRRNAEEILAQTGERPLKPAPWEQALLAFADKAKAAGIDWFLAGTCALAIRGIEVKPRDVDIILHLKDMDKVQEAFLDDTIVPVEECADWVATGFGVLFMHARIDLAFDTHDCLDSPEPIDSGPYAMNHLETVNWMGHTVKVPPMALLLNVNKRRGIQERVQLIEEYVASRS